MGTSSSINLSLETGGFQVNAFLDLLTLTSGLGLSVKKIETISDPLAVDLPKV